MREYILNVLTGYGMNSEIANYLFYILMAVFVGLVSFMANLITKKVILKILAHYIRNNRFKWDTIMLERRVFQRMSHIVPAIIIYAFAPVFPENVEAKIYTGVTVYITLVVMFVISAFLNSVNDIYNNFEISKTRPIKGFIQIVKVFVFVIGGILIIAEIIGQNPLVLLGGLGALSAVVLLIFQDSILGLVAGIQLSSNDMVRVGDWIEMSNYGADGYVIDISLNTVKVQNFDKTITTIPTYKLVSDSLKNWRGMVETGGRRIKRSVYIDTSSITFCTDEMIDEFKKIHYLKDHIMKKQKEIAEYNKKNNIDASVKVNGRRLTNIGVFRAYVSNYLKNHPGINKNMIQMVRQLPPGEYGLPIEVYAFTKTTNWVEYEGIQADIFDHILAVVPEFKLKVFQNPTGYDFRSFGYKGVSGMDNAIDNRN
ncbi:mechanosensitive ion channel family protein [Acetivibrio saccincola]|uniref:Mechanosensing system component YbdG n=1 Tax=Acetivibrio saccincola TaxID=1677857 RepID=A0A2K9EHX0_9FIRM|nr:mechanosensitive ion channel domain-containing protein [Acetivibrio saccincola]AUG56101.1 Miniconductance mechanosensitive channel YbdG [Acetivibrio saccincola]NLW27180.1 mechanosensitive ion channel [Acetivibrio saccincola]